MFTRIKYHFQKQAGNTVLLILIYTAIILFFCSTILITNVADLFNDTFAKSLDIYVSVDHPLEGGIGMDYDIDQYLSESNEVYQSYSNLSDSEGIEWSNLTERNGDGSFMIPGYLDDNGILHIVSTVDSNQSPTTEWIEESNFNIPVYARIYGTTSGQIPELQFNKVQLTTGRTFTQDELDQGEDVCVLYNTSFFVHDVEGKSVQEQKIIVGDTIPISVFQFAEDGSLQCLYRRDLKVVGIVKGISSLFLMEERIYMPMKTFRSLEEAYLNFVPPKNAHRSYYSSAALFKVDTIEHLNGVTQKIEDSKVYQSGLLSYYSTTDAYASLIADIYTTTQGFRVISYACFVLAIVMSIALTMILMRYRRRENMILYAMGEREKTLTVQNILENGLFMVPALLIGIPGSLKLSRKFTESLFEAQNTSFNEGVSTALKSSGIETAEIKPDMEAIRQYISMSNKQWIALIILIISVLITTGIISWLNEKKMHVRDLLN